MCPRNTSINGLRIPNKNRLTHISCSFLLVILKVWAQRVVNYQGDDQRALLGDWQNYYVTFGILKWFMARGIGHWPSAQASDLLLLASFSSMPAFLRLPAQLQIQLQLQLRCPFVRLSFWGELFTCGTDGGAMMSWTFGGAKSQPFIIGGKSFFRGWNILQLCVMNFNV